MTIPAPAIRSRASTDDNAGKITFVFQSDWTGNRQVGGLAITAQPDVGTLTATATAAAVLDLTSLSGDTSGANGVNGWSLALTGISAITGTTGSNLDARGASLAGLINATSYSASYKASTNVLLIWRDSGTTAFTATLTETFGGGSPPADRVVTDASDPAYLAVLGGTIREGQAWNLDLSGIASDPSYPVPVIDSGSNPTFADIATTAVTGLIAQINTKAGYNAVLSGTSDIFIFGPASFTVTADVVPAAAAATAIVEGTVQLSWKMTLTPDVTGYPGPLGTLNVGDVWSITRNGVDDVTYTVTLADLTTYSNSLLAFLEAKIAGGSIATSDAIADTPAGTLLVTTTDGGLIEIGNLKWTRAHPFVDDAATNTQPYTSITPWNGADHYTVVVVDVKGTAGLQDVSAGQTYSVFLNGEKLSYLVPGTLEDGTEAGELNFKTVAAGLVAEINLKSHLYTASVVADASLTKIQIVDKNGTGSGALAGGGHGLNPVAFTAERGGDVYAVIDIDNSKLIKGTTQVFTGEYRIELDYYLLGIFPIYKTVPVFETVNYTISLRLELIDPANPSAALATVQYTPGQTGIVDPGSADLYDPFLEFKIPASAGASKPYLVRVSSVWTYDKFLPQYVVPGVWKGLSYELVVSLPGHPTNNTALELAGKTLQVVDGQGAGQAGLITDYDPKTKAFYLSTVGFDNWTATPLFDSKYDISTRLSIEGQNPGNPDYAGYLNNLDKLISDSWGVVLTKAPGAGVVINVLPTETRTYNADEAFNPDAAFGENYAQAGARRHRPQR